MMRATVLNFIPVAAPVMGWRLLLLLLGACALLAWGQRWQAQNAVNAQLQQQLAQSRPVPKASAPTRSAEQQRDLEAHAKVVAEAVRQLNLPVAKLFAALQPPKDIRVALLALDLNAKTGSGGSSLLKITAEARTPQEMMAWVAFLDEQALFQSVYLVKHELAVSQGGGEPGWRFLLEAQWRP
jgi:hypothetical protein